MFRFRDRWQTSLGELFRVRNEPSITDRLLALLEDRDRDLEDWLNGAVDWISMGLGGTGWANYGSGWAPAAFRKVGDMVQIRGLIAGGTSGTAIAVMPVGFRPPGNLISATSCDVGGGNVFARLDVLSNGSVTAYFPAGTAAYLSINCSYSVTP